MSGCKHSFVFSPVGKLDDQPNAVRKCAECGIDLLGAYHELEQQLADAKASMDSIEATLLNQWKQAEVKLTERDKLLDECERWLEWFVCNGPKPTLEINSINLLSAIKERKHD